MKMNDNIIYTLPAYYDLESNPVTFTFVPSMSSFLAFAPTNPTTLTFHPVLFTDVGVYSVTLTIADG